MTPKTKSSVEQTRNNLETGQSVAVDAPLSLNLIARAAAAVNPQASWVLDIGCGAGNYTLKLLQSLPNLNVMLVDLSRPMLDRAVQRIRQVSSGEILTARGDIRELPLGGLQFDIILAAAIFHHLRTDSEWRDVLAKCYAALKPGGSIWISDYIEHSIPGVQKVMWESYGEYLTMLKDKKLRDQVFALMEKEDTPRSVVYQIDMLRAVGFKEAEIIHKNSCYAAFGAIK
ncbi:MAG: class I SAM-dependent methyltransferase [Deltaproteobacteria bacterium]|nr:class I SAM-dependent methyltransferase [Deltaproteobacteria bacterium]